MINCKTGKIIYFDKQLLDENFWAKDKNQILLLLNTVLKENKNETLISIVHMYLHAINNYPLFLNFEENKVKNFNSKYILVLGKSLNPDSTLKQTLINRLKFSLDIYNSSRGSKIIVSGKGNIQGITEAQAMKNWLLEKKVLNNDIFIEEKSQDTIQNIIISTKILTDNCAQEVILITSEDHILRASSLMYLYLKEKNIKINFSSFSSKIDIYDDHFDENKEKFILFKDIGRVLGFWDYQNS